MYIKATLATALVLTTAGLTGCTEQIDSQNLKTAGIAATVEVTSPSTTRSDVLVTLQAGGDESNTYVVLGGGDRIYAEIDGTRNEMTVEDDGEYIANFGTGQGGVRAVISLEREEDDDAPSSVGTLPAPFDITPISGEVSRADPLTIEWSPSGETGKMELEVNGTCIFLETIDIGGDPGTYTIQPGDLKPTTSGETETCDLDITMKRSVGGTADPAFDDESSVALRQVRKTTVRSAP